MKDSLQIVVCRSSQHRKAKLMSTRSNGRLVCNPNASTAAYMSCLEQYMQSQGTRDLKGLLTPMEREVSWKTAPRLSILVQYQELYRSLFVQSPNTIFSHSKLVAAITGCHASQPCLFTHRPLGMEASALSALLRMGAAKWRDLKKCESARSVLMRKVDTLGWARSVLQFRLIEQWWNV